MSQEKGFSLIELMVTVAIIAIVAAIAIPAYQNYLQTAREGVLVHNIQTMRVFQEDFRLRNGAYAAFTYESSNPSATPIGWQPDSDGAGFTYTVTVEANPPRYTVVATDGAGTTVTRSFP
ncbi:MAG: prepilin-type N-terminal cleavage/methylation domain-containing protein [Gammaproteobacteria bacterium]|nr:prepilin-type N-terminal cleavage/methylation domain-containing protein [Gammaproteobacteria bacterium]